VSYKVFLVEDEIVAREGIRDNVDWRLAGFEFCGEAPDGEMALPLIENTQPDVLITDIKMPFMDGLQLCKIVRDRMPSIKIIILTGHDEFDYAQEAVKLGVTEYLLKPVGVQDLHQVLGKVAAQLDRERQEQENLQQLKDQVEDNLALRRERFLLKLVMGGLTSPEAIKKSQQLGLDIIAKCYLVVLIRAKLGDHNTQFDYNEFQQVRHIASGLIENNPDAFLLRKDLEELVLILKGDRAGYLEQEGRFLIELIRNEVESKTNCSLLVGFGGPQVRISDIPQSFTEALLITQNEALSGNQIVTGNEADQAELLKLDKSALEDYLKLGTIDDFDDFFEGYLRPLGESALRSYLIKNYVFIDIVLTTAKFVHRLGGVVDQVIPEINNVETLLMHVQTVEQIRAETREIFASALAFRDTQTHNQHGLVIHQAKEYIGHHSSNSDLSLNDVAAHVNLSPSHFSTVFSRETGETFSEYLTRIRIGKAKELLRTTSLKSFEIADRVGYGDPHYFSTVFKKNTGFTPIEFRLSA